MTRHLRIAFLFIGLIGCNLGTAQQLEDTQITQYPPVTIENNVVNTDDIQLSAEITSHLDAIYVIGQQRGNRDYVFSKVGDSITVSRNFLHPFGIGRYDLGDYPYLESTVAQFSQYNARIGNSFINESLAAHEGWSANHVLNPQSANARFCQAGESPLLCEYRIVQPTIAIIMFGTNDAGYRTAEQYTTDMREIIRLTEAQGIIPILSTIPNRPDTPFQVVSLNNIVQQLATEHHLPLIDLYTLTFNLPNYGLTSDNVHLSSSPFGLTATATFDSTNLNYGYVVRNLATLQALNIVQQVIQN